MKTKEMNYEIIRKNLIEIYTEYKNPKKQKDVLTKMKEIVEEYDDVIDILEETLNCAFGIMEAITQGKIKDKKEEEQIVNDILTELKEKSYLGA